MTPPAHRSVGPSAFLIDTGDRRPAEVAAALASRPGIAEVVPGAATVLVVATSAAAVARLVADPDLLPDSVTTPSSGPTPEVLIEVRYDGADLAAVARHTGLSEDEVIGRHSGVTYEAAFVGFAPGFAYLTGLPAALHLPRREQPRAAVPAGAVAIADVWTAAYPRSSPGGWHLLGTTREVLFDPDRDPPSRLVAGTRVRFVPVDTLAPVAAPSAAAAVAGPRLVVVEAGGSTTIQDRGRPGRSAAGVPPSGVADPASAALANRLVGNAEGAPVLETTLAGPVLRLEGGRARAVAVTGPSGPVTVDGHPRPGTAAFVLAPGSALRVGPPEWGLRRYVAVGGGITARSVLGSVSTDLLSGLGPPVLADGDELGLGVDPGPHPGVDAVPVRRPPGGVIRVHPGPQEDWLTPAGRGLLLDATWTVAPTSNRIGTRLTGPVLERSVTGELPSAGLVRGAVQLTPSGELVVFGPDHPVTGGYPVVAVVTGADLAAAAQLRPGDPVRLVRST